MSFLNCRLQDPSHFLAVRHGTPCNASLAYVAGNPGRQQPRSSKRHRPWWLTLCLCVSVCERGGKVSMDCGHWCAKVVAAMREHVDCVWPEVWLSVCVCDSVVVALPEWDFLRKFQLCLLDWMFDDAKVAIVLLLSFFFFFACVSHECLLNKVDCHVEWPGVLTFAQLLWHWCPTKSAVCQQQWFHSALDFLLKVGQRHSIDLDQHLFG